MTKRSTRVLSMVLVLALVVTMMTGVMTASAVSYKDINSSHWAKTYIDYLSNESVFQGDNKGKFNPDKAISTAELMAVINRTFGLTATTGIGYSDVKAGSWYYTDVAKAAAQGYIISEGSYVYPNADLTREKAVAMIARYLGLEPTYSAKVSFADASKIDSRYVGYVNAAVAAGIIDGYKENGATYFKPTRALERDEVAKIIYTMLGGNIIRASVSNKTANGGCITKGNIAISNSYLTGTVYVSEGASSGTITISGSTIGKLVVRGNATISLNNSTVAILEIDSASGASNVYATGTTVVRSAEIKSAASLSDTTTSGGAFAKVNAAMSGTGKLSLAGAFPSVTVSNPYAVIDIPAAASSVASLSIAATATGASVTGSGVISSISVQASGVTTQQVPKTYAIGAGLKATFAGKQYTGTGTGSASTTGFNTGFPYVNATTTNGTLNVSVAAQTAQAGTLYVVAYPDSLGTMSAANIQAYASYSYTGVKGTAVAMSANSTTYAYLTVTGVGTASYEVAAVFVPTGGTSATYLPVYADANGNLYMTTTGTGSTGSALTNVSKIEKNGTLSLMLGGTMYVRSGTGVVSLTSANAGSYIQVLNANGTAVSTADYTIRVSSWGTQTYVNVSPNTGKLWPDGAIIYITGLCDASGNAYGTVRETFVATTASGAPTVTFNSNNSYSHNKGTTIAHNSTVYLTYNSTADVLVYVPANHALYKIVGSGAATKVTNAVNYATNATVTVTTGTTVSFYTVPTNSVTPSAYTTFSVTSTGSSTMTVSVNNVTRSHGDKITITRGTYAAVQVTVPAGYYLWQQNTDGSASAVLNNLYGSSAQVYTTSLGDGTYTFYLRNYSNVSASYCTIEIEDGSTSYATAPTISYSGGAILNGGYVYLPSNLSSVTLSITVPSGHKLYKSGSSTVVYDNTTGAYKNTTYTYTTSVGAGSHTYYTTLNNVSSSYVTAIVSQIVNTAASIKVDASTTTQVGASSLYVEFKTPVLDGYHWQWSVTRNNTVINTGSVDGGSMTNSLATLVGTFGWDTSNVIEKGTYTITLTGTRAGYQTFWANSVNVTVY